MEIKKQKQEMATGMKYEQRLAAAAHLAELEDDQENLPTAEEVAQKCREWGIMAELKPHQSEGVSWLIRRYVRGVNVILVVLCPLSVTDGWASEFAKFSPSLKVLSYVGDKEHRLEMRKEIFEYVSKWASKSGVCADFINHLTLH